MVSVYRKTDIATYRSHSTRDSTCPRAIQRGVRPTKVIPILPATGMEAPAKVDNPVG